MLEQRQGLTIRPLEVIENDDDRLLAGRLLEQADGRPAQQVALGLGVGLLSERGGRRLVAARPGASRVSSPPWRSTWRSITR